MIPVFLCLQLVLWGHMIRSGESIALNSSEVIENGKWVLNDHSSATLVCTVSPFTGIMIWRFNSLKVAECNIQNCGVIRTGDGAFSFGFDTEHGVFEWTISPVDRKKHNGQFLECNDGTNKTSVIAIVTESEIVTNDAERLSLPDYNSIFTLLFTIINFTIVVIFLVIYMKNERSVGTHFIKTLTETMEKNVTTISIKVADQTNTLTNIENLIKTDESGGTTSLNTYLQEIKANTDKIQQIHEYVCIEESTASQKTLKKTLKEIFDCCQYIQPPENRE